MTGNKIITVHSIRREHKKHKTKQKAPKQSDDYHNTLTVQPNLPVFLERASLAVFVFCALLNIAELRLSPFVQIQQNLHKRVKL